MIVISPVNAQQVVQSSVDYQGELPPLIDRQTFFGDPQYANAKISPDGNYISFLKEYKGKMNIWVKGVDEPFKAAEPVTADTTRPIRSYFWTQTGDRILYRQDKGGNENYHIYAVDPDAEASSDTGVPPAEDLTPYENIQARIYAVPENTPHEIIVGLNDRNKKFHDVYRLNLKTGKRSLIHKNERRVASWVTDLKGNLRLAVKKTPKGGTKILRVTEDTLRKVYVCDFGEACNPIRFHKDHQRVYLVTNKGQSNLTRLVLFNPKTGNTSLVEKDPRGKVDFGGTIFSDKTEELVATYYVGDRKRVYPKTERFKRMYETLKSKLDGEISIHSSTEDGSQKIVSASRDVDPGSVYLYDRKTQDLQRLYRSRPDLPSNHLASMKPIKYEARDGVTIPAYLITPKGVKANNLPTIVLPHGGPWTRVTWGYNAYGQFLANRGYAVLLPNFRGSTGYGKDFLNAGNKEWGRGVMQHDLTDGVRYLIEQGIADSSRIGIFGGSYGGYATLAGLTFTPDLYAAGASYVGPSNLITLINSLPPYWAPIKTMFTKRVGNPENAKDRKRLKRQSPFFHAENIEDPLLVIQGANDPRVKKKESDQIVVAARKNNVPVQYLVAPNEGHGFAKEPNRLAVAAKLEKFFGKHLGGRYQQDAEDFVRERLQKLTVNPDSVSLPKKEKDKAKKAAEKKSIVDMVKGNSLKSVTLNYNITMKMRGRSVDLSTSRRVSSGSYQNKKSWVVVGKTKTSRATVTDSLFMSHTTLQPIRRHTSGPLTLKVNYTDTLAKGELTVRGKTIPIEQSFEQPAFASGSNVELVLAAMPLEKGFSTSIPVFYEQKRKVRRMQFTVQGKKQVKVPSGSYATYKVDLSSSQGSVSGTLYVRSTAPHHVIKSELQRSGPRGSRTVIKKLKSLKH